VDRVEDPRAAVEPAARVGSDAGRGGGNRRMPVGPHGQVVSGRLHRVLERPRYSPMAVGCRGS
jgi:hypothetical protein